MQKILGRFNPKTKKARLSSGLFSSFPSELFGERERNRNRRVSGLHLAEGPAANCILDFGVEFCETGRRRNSRDADDFATRSNRELQGNLTLESRFLLQEGIFQLQ